MSLVRSTRRRSTVTTARWRASAPSVVGAAPPPRASAQATPVGVGVSPSCAMNVLTVRPTTTRTATARLELGVRDQGTPISRPKEFFWVKLLAATPTFSPGAAGDHVSGATGGEGLARARCNRMARPMAGCSRHKGLEGDWPCRSAKVGHSTAAYQLNNDPDFAAQAEAAKAHAIDLLHTRAFQRCLEGDIEPIYWQGIVVGHVRKFDTRLQIEMLRAHMPATFKTPGQAPVNVSTGDKILVMDEVTRAKLIEKRRQALALMPKATDEDPAT